MINLGRKNAAKMNATNVSFIHSRINKLPLETNSVDCIISNCVLNLVPLAEKPSVFTEIARVLKPGGRLAVSDFLAYKPLPEEMRNDPTLLVGCVAGAVTVPEMHAFLVEAGFKDMLLVDTHKDLGLYKEDNETSSSVTPCCSSGGPSGGPSGGGDSACGPMQPRPRGRKPLNYDLNQWIGKSASSSPSIASPHHNRSILQPIHPYTHTYTHIIQCTPFQPLEREPLSSRTRFDSINCMHANQIPALSGGEKGKAHFKSSPLNHLLLLFLLPVRKPHSHYRERGKEKSTCLLLSCSNAAKKIQLTTTAAVIISSSSSSSGSSSTNNNNKVK